MIFLNRLWDMTQTGEIDNKGCPWNDSDKDGVFDINDGCVNEKGTIENNGCPDKVKDILLKKIIQLFFWKTSEKALV